jgi:hypothetical protein
MRRFGNRRFSRNKWNDNMALYVGLILVIAPVVGTLLVWLYEAGS